MAAGKRAAEHKPGGSPYTPTTAELRAAEAEARRAERGDVPPAAPPRAVFAPTFQHATHPEHGEPVVFAPGELLPGWAADRLVADGDGSWHIREVTRDRRREVTP